METDELKKIWKTLAQEKLIGKEIAKEHIEQIIALKSSSIIEKLSKNIRKDYITSIGTATLILAITIFATVFLKIRNSQLPIQGYIFLILCFSFYAFKALHLNSKFKLLHLSFNTSSLLESLQKVKGSFEKISKKEATITYISIALLTIYANVLINDQLKFTSFELFNLQGIVLIFSIVYLVSLNWVGKYIFKKRFSGIIDEINKTIDEINSEF